MVFLCVAACAYHLVQFGFPRLAAELLVQFAGFLRPKELLALRREDATLPELVQAAGIARGPFALLALGTAGRGTKDTRKHIAKVRRPWAIDALRCLQCSTARQPTALASRSCVSYLTALVQGEQRMDPSTADRYRI